MSYWLDRGAEVDYVLQRGDRVIAFEVKSGRARCSLPGMAAFRRRFPDSRPLLVGGEGISVEEFLTTPVDRWLR